MKITPGQKLNPSQRQKLVNRDNQGGSNVGRNLDYTNQQETIIQSDPITHAVQQTLTISSDVRNNEKFVHAIGNTPVSAGMYANDGVDSIHIDTLDSHATIGITDDQFLVATNGTAQNSVLINNSNNALKVSIGTNNTSLTVEDDSLIVSTPQHEMDIHVQRNSTSGNLSVNFDNHNISRSVSRDQTQKTRTETDNFIDGIVEQTIVDYNAKSVTFNSSNGDNFTIVDGSGGSNPPPSIDLTQCVTNAQYPIPQTLDLQTDSIDFVAGSVNHNITVDKEAETITVDGITISSDQNALSNPKMVTNGEYPTPTILNNTPDKIDILTSTTTNTISVDKDAGTITFNGVTVNFSDGTGGGGGGDVLPPGFIANECVTVTTQLVMPSQDTDVVIPIGGLVEYPSIWCEGVQLTALAGIYSRPSAPMMIKQLGAYYIWVPKIGTSANVTGTEFMVTVYGWKYPPQELYLWGDERDPKEIRVRSHPTSLYPLYNGNTGWVSQWEYTTPQAGINNILKPKFLPADDLSILGDGIVVSFPYGGMEIV